MGKYKSNSSVSSTVTSRKKYFATFPNGIEIEITKEYADKILRLQKIIREQREKEKEAKNEKNKVSV